MEGGRVGEVGATLRTFNIPPAEFALEVALFPIMYGTDINKVYEDATIMVASVTINMT